MLSVVSDKSAVRQRVANARLEGRTIALVPTMGCLHEGHLELVRRARAEGHWVCVSIFVNPTQFGPGEDFDKYPRTFERDRELCEKEGVELIFAPEAGEMYSEGSQTIVRVPELARPLCGAHREGHFDGVATVVTKLFNIVAPDEAYFGEKDFQQLQVIKRMVADLDMPLTIRPVPTVREADGLAMSSRNKYLSEEERTRALSINQALTLIEELVVGGEGDASKLVSAGTALLEEQGLVPEYFDIRDPDTLEELKQIDGPAVVAVAARVGETRLIDNRVVKPQITE